MRQTPPERTTDSLAPTIDEWQAAVDDARAASAGHGDGATVRELSQHMGKSESTIRRALRIMVDAGTAMCLQGRASTAINGQAIQVPSYIFITKEEKPKRGRKRKTR